MIKRIVISAAVTAMLVTSTTVPIPGIDNVVSAQNTMFTPTKLNAVYLTSKSYVKFKNIDIIESEQGRAMTFTITVYNGESRTIDLLDYWFRVKNKSGSIFKVKAADTKIKEVIPSKSNKDFTYYAEIDDQAKLSDLLIEVIKWDFSVPNYEKKIGSIQIPSSYNYVAPFNQPQQIKWSNQLITTKLSKATLSSDAETQALTVTWELQNNGTLPIKLSGTKFIVRTANGLVYPIDYDSSADNVSAKGKKVFVFTANVPQNVSLTNARLMWLQQGEGMPYALPIASHFIKTTKEQQQVADTLKLNFNSQLIEAKTKQLTTTSVSNTLNNLNITYELKNTGKKSATIPILSFEYKSANGSVYPIELKDSTATVLNPGLTKTMNLSVEVPATEVTGKGTLSVYENTKNGDREVKRLLGAHNVTITSQVSKDIKFGTKAPYTNTQGKYEITVDKIYRNPWNNEDLIQAEIEVFNAQNKDGNLSIPDLTVSIYLDGVLLKNTVQIVKTSNKVGIGKGESIKFLVIAKVPYSQSFTNIKIEPKEKIGENNIHIASFSGTNAINQPTRFKIDQSIQSKRSDKKSSIKINKVKTYEGRNTNLIYTDIELMNAGVRVDSVSTWMGYFRNKEGLVFPAIIGDSSNMISPSGRISTFAYAAIPKNVGFTDFELVLGEAINGDGFTNRENATAYVHPFVVDIGYSSVSSPTTLESLDLYPYTFTMRNVLAGILDESRILFSFDYDLEQNNSSEVDLTKHDLILEIEDANGKVYETNLKLNDDLKVSKFQNKEIIIQDSNLFANVPKFGTYKLKVYDVVNNHKRLIGSKQMEWFIRS